MLFWIEIVIRPERVQEKPSAARSHRHRPWLAWSLEKLEISKSQGWPDIFASSFDEEKDEKGTVMENLGY